MAAPTVKSNPQPVADLQDGPVPLSFPALLRNPKLSDRFAHLRRSEYSQDVPLSRSVRRKTRGENEGRRWIRRKENAHFVGNPHVVHASRKDYDMDLFMPRTTFPEPLPPFLSRNTRVPSASQSIFDPKSANAGRFSLSIKGMRRELRQSGWRTRGIVRDVEEELVNWLVGGTMMLPDSQEEMNLDRPGCMIGSTESIVEIARSPLQLIWSIPDDAFARYVVHCCARYHKVISFSKDVSGRRLTYLLRPNVARPDFNATADLDTPPVTDLDYSSHGFDTDQESVVASGLSDIEEMDQPRRPLSVLSEFSDILAEAPEAITNDETPMRASVAQVALDELNFDGDESGTDIDLAESIESLSLAADAISESTPRSIRIPRLSRLTMESRLLWARSSVRSASSPSRSPARRPPIRTMTRKEIIHQKPILRSKQSFYDYLFS